MGGNATITRLFFDSLSSLLSNLKSSPNESQKAVIRQGVTEVLGRSDDFYAAFPGLENFKNNTDLQSNPSNARFFQLYEQFQNDGRQLIANPAYALEYFSNSSTISRIIEIAILTGKTSLQARYCEYYHENFFGPHFRRFDYHKKM
jgi:hypothetical protein